MGFVGNNGTIGIQSYGDNIQIDNAYLKNASVAGISIKGNLSNLTNITTKDCDRGIMFLTTGNRFNVSNIVILSSNKDGISVASGNILINGSNWIIHNSSQDGIGVGYYGLIITDTARVNIKGFDIESSRTDASINVAGTTKVRLSNGIWSNTLNGVFITNAPQSMTGISLLTPVGPVGPPAVPATTVNYTNAYGYPCDVLISGGTVTEIDIEDIATGLTFGWFTIPPGGTINITYSAAPSWLWWGL